MRLFNVTFVAIILLLFVGLRTEWFGSKESETSSDQGAPPAKVSATSERVVPRAQPNAKRQEPSKSSDSRDATDERPLTPLDFESFKKLVRADDLLNDLLRTASVQKLRSENPEQVARFFMDMLADIGPTGALERLQLLSIADAWQDDALLPFWEDLALRKNPFLPEEETIMAATEPSTRAMNISSEMTTAIRHLGVIAPRDSRAQGVLAEIVMKPRTLHTTALRKRALLAMQEGDQNAALRTLKSLAEDDELRKAIRFAQKYAAEMK